MCARSCVTDIVRVCVCLPVCEGACDFFPVRECVYIRTCMLSFVCLTVRARVCMCVYVSTCV